MKLKTMTSLLSLSAAVYLSGCGKVESDQLKNDVRIYQDYEVTYDKTKGITTAYAQFRPGSFDGAGIILKSDSRILANDESAYSEKDFGFYFYGWKFNGHRDVTFKYIKSKDHVFENKIEQPDLSLVSLSGLSKISKSQGFILNFSDKELGNDEQVSASLMLSDIQTKSPDVVSRQLQTGNIVSFTGEDLKAYETGQKVIVKVKRTKKTDRVQQSDGVAGGTIQVSISEEKKLTIGE